MKVFLGGTNNGSKWRDVLTRYLRIDYFDPTTGAAEEPCDVFLYVLTPKMTDIYPITDIICGSDNKTVFCFLAVDEDERFDCGQMKALNMIGEMAVKNGAVWATSLDDAAWILNRMAGKESDPIIEDPSVARPEKFQG